MLFFRPQQFLFTISACCGRIYAALGAKGRFNWRPQQGTVVAEPQLVRTQASLAGGSGMKSRTWLPMLAAVSLSATIVGCGGNPRPQLSAPPASTPPSPQRPAVQPPAPATPAALPANADPIAILIGTSQRHFENGERELKLGHLERARTEFDRAVDVLLESTYGARTEPRVREHFDRLIDRISAYEVSAL